MAEKSHLLTWKPIFEAFKETGFLSEERANRTYRIVIDAEVGEACIVTFYEYAGSELVGALGAVEKTDCKSEAIVR